MKRAWIVIAILGALGVVGGALFMRLSKNVKTVVAERNVPAPRVVGDSWPYDRFSPGHSLHVINFGVECNDCHDPGRTDFSEVDIGMCTSCHEEQAAIAHVGSEAEPTECLACHAFKFDSPIASAWDCARCHGPFDTETHAGLAMHNDITCESCHHPHEPIGDTLGNCTSCHTGIGLEHGRAELSGGCVDCHGGHQLATEAASCMKCHAKDKPRVALTATFAGGHNSCATCHEAHEFTATKAASCESCHRRTNVLAERTAAAHRDCASCHEPHAVRAAGDSTCAGCHDDVASTHPLAEGEACISCHVPHPEQRQQLSAVALECSSCHEDARSDRAFHAGGATCTSCHQPHGFDLQSLTERELCVQCHQQQVTLTSRNEGHQSCESCHTGTAHALTGPVGCDSCHEEILASSPSGHQECASCHEPHKGGVLSAQQSCTTCHAMAGLPGLHRLPAGFEAPGHTDCTSCHDVHISRARADRETCMTCHEDIADHEPTAKRCTGCHTFISGQAALMPTQWQ